MPDLIEKIFAIPRARLKVFLPFFGLYFSIFIILTMAENLALSLFIEHFGVSALPRFYKYTAVISFAAVMFYMKFESRWPPFRLLNIFLLGLITPFVFIISPLGELNMHAIGMAFICKEIGFIFVFLHFGSLLQHYFHREKLNEAIPFIYSGGRLGAFVGGIVIVQLTTFLDLRALGYGLLVAFTVYLIISTLIQKRLQPIIKNDVRVEEEQPLTLMVRLIRRDSFLQWLVFSAFLFMVCRWLLNFQTNAVLDTLHRRAIDIARFMGYYTTVAMVLSLFIQMVLLQRIIRRFGVVKTDVFFNICLVLGFMATPMPHSTYSFAIMRFVENELRFAIRNPLNQIFSNAFNRNVRTIARSLVIGAANPLAAMFAGLLLAVGQKYSNEVILIIGLVMLSLYILSCKWRYKYYRRTLDQN